MTCWWWGRHQRSRYRARCCRARPESAAGRARRSGRPHSSASTKLIHGGLRYLEYYEFRLVREALQERERLIHIAPHISWPLRFVLPSPKGPPRLDDPPRPVAV
jgi:hypothetical protein